MAHPFFFPLPSPLAPPPLPLPFPITLHRSSNTLYQTRYLQYLLPLLITFPPAPRFPSPSLPLYIYPIVAPCIGSKISPCKRFSKILHT